MNKLLIWDIDGTLIQSGGLGKRAMDRAFLELYGVEDGFEGINMAGMIDSSILKIAYENHNLENKTPKEFFDRYAICLEAEIKRLQSPVAAPGILDLMELLATKKDIYNVLGTGNIEIAARLKLDIHNMSRFFATGGFGEKEAERWQVIAEAVDKASSCFGIAFSKENIYVIGDTPKDIDCGKKLGIKSIGVATGPYSCSQLAECHPDFYFEDFTKPEGFLNTLNA